MATLRTMDLKLPKYMSLNGIKNLKKKHQYLQSQLKKLRGHLSELNRQEVRVQEDHAWLEALESVHVTEQELRMTEKILASVKAFRPAKNAETVQLGSTVELQSGKKTLAFTIVTSIEADPSERKISDESPIGLAVLGKKRGERISVQTNAQNPIDTVYTLTNIS